MPQVPDLLHRLLIGYRRATYCRAGPVRANNYSVTAKNLKYYSHLFSMLPENAVYGHIRIVSVHRGKEAGESLLPNPI